MSDVPQSPQNPRNRPGEDMYSLKDAKVPSAGLICLGDMTRNWAIREDVHLRHIVPSLCLLAVLVSIDGIDLHWHADDCSQVS